MSAGTRSRCRSFWLLAFPLVVGAALAGCGSSEGGSSSPCILVSCSIPGSGGPSQPVPAVVVVPPYVTVQAGTSVTWSTQLISFRDTPIYQWSRSSDGGKTFVNIPGATASSYSLAATQADDGAVFRVSATPVGTTFPATARAYIAVSSKSPVVFRDGEFAPQTWTSTPETRAGVSTFAYGVERVPDGGAPGAFQRTTVQIPPGAGWAAVLYTATSVSYDPAVQGAIQVIDFAEDCVLLFGSEFSYALHQLLLEQNGRRYIPTAGVRSTPDCYARAWSPTSYLSTLYREDFAQIDGPSCASGEQCPDFSGSGRPIRFGARRGVSGSGLGEPVAHGVDNWTVTVWRK